MSKQTLERFTANPLAVGTIVLAVSIAAWWTVRKRIRSNDSVERLFEGCESALAKMLDNQRNDYAVR